MADIDVKRIDEMIYYLKAGELADMEILLEAITRTLDDETQASTINELNVCKQMLDEILGDEKFALLMKSISCCKR